MQRIEFIMGMPIIIRIEDVSDEDIVFGKIFNYFREVDEKFSPYKQNSEVTIINNGKLTINNCSEEMKMILKLCEQTKKESDGYFDAWYDGGFDPSGIVKGWAVYNASKILDKMGYKNYYISAGGDVQTRGKPARNASSIADAGGWAIGIRNPFEKQENVKVIYLSGEGVATSGTYEKGSHIYNPVKSSFGNSRKDNSIVSLTVIGKNVYEADRFATAAFAMGKDGIEFIEDLKSFEGYMVDKDGIATMTSGFSKYENA